jgi:flagella basal body P-ring formation protein FlgA
VRLEPAQSDTAQSAAFQSLDEVVGKAASRAVPAGSVLQAQSVCEATLVRRGEAVTVYVRRDGLRIRTTARAHDDGALGDRITVESMLSRKKKFAARVCGPQEAEVELPGAAADARP